MKLATITNTAYVVTVALTLVSGAAMLLASNAHEVERAAVKQRFELDHSTSRLEAELYVLTGQVRQYVVDGDETHLIVYEREYERLQSFENRIDVIKDAGADAAELSMLEEAFRWAHTLHDEQLAAIEATKQGDYNSARGIVFGAEYERELERARNLLERFQDHLDQRTDDRIARSSELSKMWRLISEVMLITTSVVFFIVLVLIIRYRVLHPVIKLSDFVTRLAQQDYQVEPPEIQQVDEIGDMAQAIKVFRENGLERQRLQRERDADLEIREVLARMTQRMHSCDDTRELCRIVERFVPNIAQHTPGRLYLFDEQQDAMVAAAEWLSPENPLTSYSPMDCWAFRRGTMHPAEGKTDITCAHVDAVPEREDRSTLCIPLIAQRETLGLLYLEPGAGAETDERNRLSTHVNMMAENIGLALANLKLRDSLQRLAMSDPLTGLANRRAFNQTLHTELETAELNGRVLSCLMLDVDHFKHFNDEFGHDAGDLILQELGNVLSEATREEGMAFRYGGEEFVLLMPELSLEQAKDRAEQILIAISRISIEHNRASLGKISASIGLACFPDDCAANRLVRAADTALLKAKANGRNRVELAEPEDRRNDGKISVA